MRQRARYDSLRAALCAVARLYAPAGAVVRNDMVEVTQVHQSLPRKVRHRVGGTMAPPYYQQINTTRGSFHQRGIIRLSVATDLLVSDQ